MSTPPFDSSTPRPLTPAARRQSWRELPVRTWFAMTLCLLVVIASVGVSALLRGLSDRRLLAEGLRLNARLDNISGANRNVDRSVEREVNLSFLIPGETERRVLERVKLEPKANAPAINRGDEIPILVDRKDPRKWTDRVDPTSWIIVMAVPLLLAPPAIVLALITLAVRRRLLHVYTAGSRRTATVSDAQRSALVPGQKVVKFSVAGKTLAAAHPDAIGPVAPGDAIDIFVDHDTRPRHAIVAKAYE